MITDPTVSGHVEPDYDGFRITEIYLFAAVGDDNEEGVLSFFDGETHWPLVATDSHRFQDWTKIAQRIAVEIGKEVSITKMTVRENIGCIRPDGTVTYEKE